MSHEHLLCLDIETVPDRDLVPADWPPDDFIRKPIWHRVVAISFDQTTFGKNRDRLLAGDEAHKFLAAVLAHPRAKRLLSSEHFSVDGTVLEAWASMKSVRPKDGSGEPPAPGRNGERNFHGERRTNDTHASTTDPDARLVRKGPGREAKLGFIGHALMENRNGLVADACLTRADGHAERVAALHMVEPRADRPRRITLGADKGYDAWDFVGELRSLNVAPHVAARAQRSALRAHHASRGIQGQPDRAEADRGGLRLGQSHGGLPKVQAPRARPRRLAVHLHDGSLQPDPPTQAPGPGRMTTAMRVSETRATNRRSAGRRSTPPPAAVTTRSASAPTSSSAC